MKGRFLSSVKLFIDFNNFSIIISINQKLTDFSRRWPHVLMYPLTSDAAEAVKDNADYEA